jgi:hypothetical protein
MSGDQHQTYARVALGAPRAAHDRTGLGKIHEARAGFLGVEGSDATAGPRTTPNLCSFSGIEEST